MSWIYIKSFFFSAILLFGISFCSVAATFTWNGSADGNWNNGANWDMGAAPGSTDDAVIGNNGVTPWLSGNVSVKNFQLSGAGVSLNLNGYTLSIAGNAVSFQQGSITSAGAIGNIDINSSATAMIFIGNSGPITFGAGAIGAVTNVNVLASGGRVNIQQATFNGTLSVTKTGTNGDLWAGGNIYNGPVSIRNNSTDLLGPGYSGSETYNSTANFTNLSSGNLMVSGGSAGSTFSGITNVLNSGSGTLHLAGDPAPASAINATFNNDVYISNTGTGKVWSNYNGKCVFNGNIILSSNAGLGIGFGSGGTGSCTLANNKSITTVGGTGFSAGDLILFNFIQGNDTTGAATQLLTLTGTSTLMIGDNSYNIIPGDKNKFYGKVTFTAPSITMGSGSYFNTTAMTQTGSNNTYSRLNVFGTTGVQATFNNTGSGIFSLGYDYPETFNGNATFNNTSSGTFWVAQSSVGNIFNGTTIFNNASSGTGNILVNNGTASSTFNGNVIVYNSNYYTFLSSGGTSTYNGNIIVSSSGTSTAIRFGAGASILANNKSITTTGGTGFTAGALELDNFKQGSDTNGAAAQVLTMTGTSTLNIGNDTYGTVLGDRTWFYGKVNFTAPLLSLRGASYFNTTTITQTGNDPATAYWRGNVFGSAGVQTTLNNIGAGAFMSSCFGIQDHYNGNTTFNNTGSGNIFIAYAVAGTTFYGTTIFNNASSGSGAMSVNDGVSSSTFNGPTYFNCSNYFIFINGSAGGTAAFNDIILSSTSSGGIRFGSGISTIANNKSITTNGGTGYSAGELTLQNLKQGTSGAGVAGNTSSSNILNLTGTGSLAVGGDSISTFGDNSWFYGVVSFTAPGLALNGATYYNTSTFNKTGSSNDQCGGGDVYAAGKQAIFNHSGSGSWYLCLYVADHFFGNATFNNLGNSVLNIGHGSAGNLFNGTTIFNNANIGGSDANLSVLSQATATGTFNGPVFLYNSGVGGNSRIYFNFGGTAVFKNTITLSCTSSDGITFGQSNGTATLADGKYITTTGGTGYTAGVLLLKGFKQGTSTVLSPGTNVLTLTGTGDLQIGATYSSTFGDNSWFYGQVNFTAPAFSLNGATYYNTSTFTKTGSTGEQCNGGNVYTAGKQATFNHNGSGGWYLCMYVPDHFLGDVTFNNLGTGVLNIGDLSAGNLFNGITIFNNANTGGTNAEFDVITKGTATGTFNGPVYVYNSGVGGNSRVYFNYSGNIIFNDTITLSCSSSYGISFGQAGGTATLADGKYITTTGGTGYTAGVLLIKQFKQGTSTALSPGTNILTLTGTSDLQIGATYSITFGDNSWFYGQVNFTAPAFSLNGATYYNTSTFTKTGSTGEQCNGGNVYTAGKQATFNHNGSGGWYLCMYVPDHFLGDVTFNNLGTGVLNIGALSAGNLFNGITIFNNANTGGTNAELDVITTGTATGTFNGPVYVYNSGVGGNSRVYFNYSGTIIFNDTITLSNTSTDGITFGQAGGSATQADGKYITTIGGTGYSAGVLLIKQFKQGTSKTLSPGTNVLNLTGTSDLQIGATYSSTFGDNSWFYGQVNFTAPTLTLNGATYYNTSTFTKTGSTDDQCTGGNVFDAGVQSTFNHAGSNPWNLCMYVGDHFLGNATFNNIGTSILRVGLGSTGNLFNGTSIFNNVNTGGGNSFISIMESGSSNGIFNGPVFINNAGLGGNSTTYVNYLGTSTFNNTITVSNTTVGISFGYAGGTTNVADGKYITTTGGTGFSAGRLLLLKFRQGTSTALSPDTNVLTLTGSANLQIGSAYSSTLGDNSWFYGMVNFTAPEIHLNGASYFNTSIITKTGSATDDYSDGGNVFGILGAAGTQTTINNPSGAQFIFGVSQKDYFNVNVTFNNLGTSNLIVAYNTTGNLFKGTTIFNNATTHPTNGFIQLCPFGTATLDGLVKFNQTGIGTNSLIYSNNFGTCAFNNNITVSCTSGYGILFGNSGGTATLADDKSITTAGGGGFTTGNLYLKNFRQGISASGTAGNTSSNNLVTLTGSSILTIGDNYTTVLGDNSWFYGAVNFTAPSIFLHGASFFNTSTFTKTGTLNDVSNGGNLFGSPGSFTTTITNSSTGSMTLAGTTRDLYKRDVIFNNLSTGTLSIAYNGQNEFEDDVTCNGNLIFNGGNGVCYFTNTNQQDIWGTVSPTFPRMTVDKGLWNFSANEFGTANFTGTQVVRYGANGVYVYQLATTSIPCNNTQFGDPIPGVVKACYVSSTTATNKVNLNLDITVSENMTLDIGYIDLNAKQLSISSNTAVVKGTDIPASSGYYGFVLSENVNNTSRFTWNIGSTNGTFLYPFGNSDGTYVPFKLQLTDGGNIGNVTVTTYPTAQPDNLPFPVTPQAVTNLFGWRNSDDSPYVVDRFWQLTKTGGGGTATLSFSYADIDIDNQPITESTLRAQRYEKSKDTWQNPDSTGTTVTETAYPSTNTVVITGVEKFSPWTLASDDSPLPVDFLSVEVKQIERGVVDINWKTAREVNCDYYIVERSVDGKSFSSIGENQKAANRSSYDVKDASPVSGTNYYRVKMVEYGGKLVYSPVRNVMIEGLSDEFNIFPNPASRDNLNISLKDGISHEEVLVVLYNALGQEVYSKILINEEGNMLTAINLGDEISPGVYLIVGSTNHSIYKKKILIK